MPNCAVANCSSYTRKTKGTDIRYFRFPKNEDLAKQWIVACRRKDKINLQNACVCSLHFEEKSIEIPLIQKLLKYSPKNCRILRADAVPTLNLPGGLRKKKDDGRSLGAAKRSRRKDVEDILKSEESTSQKSEKLNKSEGELECVLHSEYVVKEEYVEDSGYVVKEEYVEDSGYVVKQEYVEDSGYVEKPESSMELDVKNELLPELHTETESEIIQLRKRIEALEKQNTELTEKVKRQDSKIQQIMTQLQKYSDKE